MTRGQREGQLTKDDLINRLSSIAANAARLQDHEGLVGTALRRLYKRDQLFGHALFHGLLSDKEVRESCPTTTHTIPCYLYTHVWCPRLRDQIDKYVIAWSQLYKRGSDIVNVIALSALSAVAHDDDTAIFDGVGHEDLEAAVAFSTEPDILKQCFLPERWPTDSVPRHPQVASVLEQHGHALEHLLPDWQAVMTATGWDNALNRMASKFLANIKTLISTTFVKQLARYFRVVLTRQWAFQLPSEELQAFQGAVDDAFRRPRPLTISNDEYALLLALRAEAGCSGGDLFWYPKKSVPLTPRTLQLHLLMARVMNTTLLPQAKLTRHFAYIDAKIGANLAVRAYSNDKIARKQVDTSSLETMLGIGPSAFNRTRRGVRRALRKRYKRGHGRDRREREHSARRARLRKKWKRCGIGKMPTGAMIASVETDGVGLRLVVQRPDRKVVDAVRRPFDPRLVAEACKRAGNHVEQVEAAAAAVLKEHLSALRQTAKTSAQKEGGVVLRSEPKQGVKPAFAAVDRGRAKILATAVTPDALKKPGSLILTRHEYYSSMRYWKQQRWEKGRTSHPDTKDALAALSRAGLMAPGLDAWAARLAAEADHYETLFNEYVVDKGRALWNMRMLRWKKSCLDGAIARIVQAATGGDKRRDLVIGIGDGGFPASAPGELSVPTSGVSVAFRRMKCRRDALIASGGGSTTLQNIGEHRTTVSCCCCGQPTRPAIVSAFAHSRKNEPKPSPPSPATRPSRRLRACTSCNETPGKLRDRDVQAARNILWLTILEFYGAERPWYMTRAWDAS